MSSAWILYFFSWRFHLNPTASRRWILACASDSLYLFGVCPCLILYILLHQLPRDRYLIVSDFDCGTLQCPCSSLKACRSLMRSSKEILSFTTRKLHSNEVSPILSKAPNGMFRNISEKGGCTSAKGYPKTSLFI